MGAFLTEIFYEKTECFVNFADKFCVSSSVSCRRVDVVHARPVFENSSEF